MFGRVLNVPLQNIQIHILQSWTIVAKNELLHLRFGKSFKRVVKDH